MTLDERLRRASAEVRRQRKALKEIVAVMGPVPPKHLGGCQGCEYEWAAALRLARAALHQTVVAEPVRRKL